MLVAAVMVAMTASGRSPWSPRWKAKNAPTEVASPAARQPRGKGEHRPDGPRERGGEPRRGGDRGGAVQPGDRLEREVRGAVEEPGGQAERERAVRPGCAREEPRGPC